MSSKTKINVKKKVSLYDITDQLTEETRIHFEHVGYRGGLQYTHTARPLRKLDRLMCLWSHHTLKRKMLQSFIVAKMRNSIIMIQSTTEWLISAGNNASHHRRLMSRKNDSKQRYFIFKIHNLNSYIVNFKEEGLKRIKMYH